MMLVFGFLKSSNPGWTLGLKVIFLGYIDGIKGYRLWGPTACKAVISGHVVFNESRKKKYSRT